MAVAGHWSGGGAARIGGESGEVARGPRKECAARDASVAETVLRALHTAVMRGYGAKHRDTRTIASNLATARKYADAARIHQEVLRLMYRMLGAESIRARWPTRGSGQSGFVRHEPE
jgi:hypothetical protein